MNILYCPWRSSYTIDVTHSKKETTPPDECVFCIQFKENKDEQYFILRRFEYHAVMFNRYPYNAGHLLILPFNHVANLHELSKESRSELTELIMHSTQILKSELNAHGFNVGLNLGIAGGAGIPSHLHYHVVPRYIGDTNFLPILGQTKQISFDLVEFYKKLKAEFESIKLD